jgi:hypothetical protein
MLDAYLNLMKDGFNFVDLVKYNDMHSVDGDSIKLQMKVGLNDFNIYQSVLKKAYLSFYLRSEFIQTYRNLLESGY